jgi:hypothetical protein
LLPETLFLHVLLFRFHEYPQAFCLHVHTLRTFSMQGSITLEGYGRKMGLPDGYHSVAEFAHQELADSRTFVGCGGRTGAEARDCHHCEGSAFGGARPVKPSSAGWPAKSPFF